MKYDKQWYDSLIKPKFQPPTWIFAPVWTILYTMMFVALFVVLTSKLTLLTILATSLFSVQFILNLSWSPIFFAKHNLKKAFYVAVLLAISVFATMICFFFISKIAGLLFLPYFLWCSFASVLSFAIMKLNNWLTTNFVRITLVTRPLSKRNL